MSGGIKIELQYCRTDEFSGLVYLSELPHVVQEKLQMADRSENAVVVVQGDIEASYHSDELKIVLPKELWISNDRLGSHAALFRIAPELFDLESLKRDLMDSFPVEEWLNNVEGAKIDEAYESWLDSRGEE